MLVFTVLVSLPTEICSKQVYTLRNENIMLRRTYPKEADHLEEYGNRQQNINLPTKMNANVRNKKYIPNYHKAIELSMASANCWTFVASSSSVSIKRDEENF